MIGGRRLASSHDSHDAIRRNDFHRMSRYLLAPLLALLLSACGRPPEDVRDHRAHQADQGSGNHPINPDLLLAEPPGRNARLPFFHKPVQQSRSSAPDDWFEDVTTATGISFAYRDGQEAGLYQLLENIGGGVAILDYDGDDRSDIFLTGGGALEGHPVQVSGHPSALYRNEGGGKFRDVTQAAGVVGGNFYSHGVAVGDFNRDGWPDLFIGGFQGCQLLCNNRHGGFEDVTQKAGLVIDRWAVTGAWVDIDNDSWLDLYVITYCDWRPDSSRRCQNDQHLRDICGPSMFPGAQDYLWRNRGDGTFEDITLQAGVESQSRALGVAVADLNADGWMDIFVANDVQENHLYSCRPGLPMQSIGVLAGVALSEEGERQGSMGVDVADFDSDGRPDLWYTNYANQDNSLLRNIDHNGFINVGSVAGLFGRSRKWVGFGTAFADFDGDGWLDILVANGHVAYERLDSPYYQPAQLFRNNGGKRFLDVSDQGGPYFSVPHCGRGVAIGDLDNDGGLDVVISHQNDPVVVLRNRRPMQHWVRVALYGTTSNPDGVGALVSIRFAGRRVYHVVRGGGSYLSSSDRRILLPADDGRPVDVTVRWPSGRTEVFSGLSQHRTHDLHEGSGI